VKDADTGEPLPGAEVRLSYPRTDSPLAPGDQFGTTGADGVALLRAAPYGDTGVVVGAAAKGYMPEEQFLSIKALEEAGPARVILAVYSGPRPTVELVLPMGYRGVVHADVHIDEEAPCPRGQRCFRFEVPPSGVVQVSGPALLRRVDSPDFRARYTDGPPLTREAKDDEVGLWGLKSQGNRYTFLVGTHSQYTIYRSRPSEESTGDGGGKRSSGRGQGKHRRGGQPPSAPGTAGTGS
jgi:hypothetical protein